MSFLMLPDDDHCVTVLLLNQSATSSAFFPLQKADSAGSEPGLGLPGEMCAVVTADVIALPVKPHTRVCEEVINRRGRSHVYVSSSRAVDVSLGTKGSVF